MIADATSGVSAVPAHRGVAESHRATEIEDPASCPEAGTMVSGNDATADRQRAVNIENPGPADLWVAPCVRHAAIANREAGDRYHRAIDSVVENVKNPVVGVIAPPDGQQVGAGADDAHSRRN